MTKKTDDKQARWHRDRREFLKAGVSAAALAGLVPAATLFAPSIARPHSSPRRRS